MATEKAPEKVATTTSASHTPEKAEPSNTKTVKLLQDVEAALVRSITSDELGHVDRIVELVEAEVLAQLPGYDLAPAAEETVTVAGSYDGTLTLPSYPVSAVALVSVDGVALPPTGWSFTSKGYLSHPFGPAAFDGPDLIGWGSPTTEIEVTYTHGQPTGGSPLVLMIADAIAARLQAAGTGHLKSMSLGDYAESYGDWSGLIDRKRLAPYRRSAMGSIVLTGA